MGEGEWDGGRRGRERGGRVGWVRGEEIDGIGLCLYPSVVQT